VIPIRTWRPVLVAVPFGLPPGTLSPGRSLATPLLQLRPLQGITRPTCRLPPYGAPTPLMEFCPLRRMSPSESTGPRLASPSMFRPQGFPPSRRFPPRQDLPALFHAGNAHGVCPSGVFPHCQVPRLVAVGDPHGVLQTPKRRRSASREKRSPSGFHSDSGSVSKGWRGPQPHDRSPLGLHLSRVFSVICLGVANHASTLALSPPTSHATQMNDAVRQTERASASHSTDAVPVSLETGIPF
jgi:hypothetical protein